MNKPTPFALLILLIAALFWLPPVNAEQSCTPKTATIDSIQGNVEIQRLGTSTWFKASLEHGLCNGDVVKIHPQSRAVVYLQNDTVLRLDENTEVSITEVDLGNDSSVTLLQGIVHFISRTIRGLTIKTPYANAGVEGTEFVVKVSEKTTEVIVFEGKVVTKNEFGEVVLTDKQSALVEAGGAPQIVINLNPRDSVRWALYFPPLIDYQHLDLENQVIYRALESYQNNKPLRAIAELNKVEDNQKNENFYSLMAGVLLTIGRIDDAEQNITEAFKLAPEHPASLALSAMISIARNDNDKARGIAVDAEAINPNSAIVKTVLSYIEQTNFNVEGALAYMQSSVTLYDKDAFSLARLAELQLALGNHTLALDAANRAIQLNPELAHTQTIIGFVYLLQNKADKASLSFQKSIDLNSEAPLPRLGMGLVEIRNGKLSEGTRQLEIAASLDPNNSLLRSYLGKAYNEQNRVELAKTEFDIAKQLDRDDPTPYFYAAILYQTINRPLEGWKNLQTSIELNNNRAIYRSQLLLDSDQAARSSSLGHMYRYLGFEKSALTEGWQSLSLDPTNHSAHRLLAESYSSLPKHQIARASELLQSQLHQPINATPVNPQLAETDLILFEGAGPTLPSFNEYNSLFIRNGVRAKISGVAGNQSTLGDEITLSAIKDNFAFNVSQFYWDTDGFRENSDINRKLYNVFAQYQLAPNSNIQAEYRKSDLTQGQLKLQFGEESQPEFQRSSELDTYRIGFKVSAVPNSSFVGSIIYNKLRFSQNETQNTGRKIDSKINQQGFTTEFQYVLKNKSTNWVAGLSNMRNDYLFTAVIDLGIPNIPSQSAPPEDTDALYKKIYLYNYFSHSSALSTTTGLSFDVVERGKLRIDQINPKFGINWQINGSTRIRAAALKMLRGVQIVSQTLEPTQIAGFNQFYDDVEASKIQQLGLAVDYKFSHNFLGGIELLSRQMDKPLTITREEKPLYHDAEERVGRLYLNWVASDNISISTEYSREEQNIDEKINQGIINAVTHRVPLNVKYFDTRNFSAWLTGTYYEQTGDFDTTSSGSKTVSGTDNFWTLDLGMNYRLPNRWGMLTAGIYNLLDEEFNYQDTDPNNPQVWPKRFLMTRITILL